MATLAISEGHMAHGQNGEGGLPDFRRRSHTRIYPVHTRHIGSIRRTRHIFMVGDNVRKYPELFKQIVNAGHQVGNHTFNHWGGFKHTTKAYSANAEKANLLIGAHLFRPPHGWMRWEQYFWLGRKYRIVMWDLVTRDYSKWITAEDVLKNVKRYTRNGSIITFHDSLKSIDKLRYALPEALKWLKEQGYEFKTFE